MKSITARILAIAVLSLCATPFARAQTAGGVEEKLKSMEDSWAAAQLQKRSRGQCRGRVAFSGLLWSRFEGQNPE
jgi:hypothetical protein